MTCQSLENTDYKGVYSNLISHVDAKRWVNKDGGPLSHSVLWSHLNYLFKGFENEREKIKEHKKNMTPIVISREYTPTGGSHGSLVVETTETAKSRTRQKTTSLDARKPPEKAPAKGKKLKEKAAAEEKAKVMEDESMISTLTDIPRDTVKNDAVNYEESTRIYEEYWSSCTNSYITKVDEIHEISIDQLEAPPAELNVRCLEEKEIRSALKFYLEMPDPRNKMTLCAMPQNLTDRPTDFKDIAEGKFWMINGQHSVEAAKRMKDLPGMEAKYDKFKTWNCYVVWNKDPRIIRKILAWYNRVNHFQNFMPTWANNILSARNVWISLGRPTPPKEPTELGATVKEKPKTTTDVAASLKWIVSN